MSIFHRRLKACPNCWHKYAGERAFCSAMCHAQYPVTWRAFIEARFVDYQALEHSRPLTWEEERDLWHWDRCLRGDYGHAA